MFLEAAKRDKMLSACGLWTHGFAPGLRFPLRLARVVQTLERLGSGRVECEREAKRSKLETRLREVVVERERLEAETRNLSTAVGEAKTSRRPLHERLGEVYFALEAKEGEEARLGVELEALDGHAVNWDELQRSTSCGRSSSRRRGRGCWGFCWRGWSTRRGLGW